MARDLVTHTLLMLFSVIIFRIYVSIFFKSSRMEEGYILENKTGIFHA